MTFHSVVLSMNLLFHRSLSKFNECFNEDFIFVFINLCVGIQVGSIADLFPLPK